MHLNDFANGIHIDAEIPVHEDTSEASDLRPGNLWVCVGELSGKMVRCFADDLEVPFDGVFCHVNEVRIVAGERVEVSLASFDRLQDDRAALFDVSAHNATASAIADSEIG